MNIRISELAQAVKQRELLLSKEAVMKCLTQKRGEVSPVEIISARHAEKPREHVLEADLPDMTEQATNSPCK